jgi:hypothetical protein
MNFVSMLKLNAAIFIDLLLSEAESRSLSKGADGMGGWEGVKQMAPTFGCCVLAAGCDAR